MSASAEGGARIRIVCPACGASASAPAAVAGRSVKCGRCQHLFRAPVAAPVPVPAPVAAPAPVPVPEPVPEPAPEPVPEPVAPPVPDPPSLAAPTIAESSPGLPHDAPAATAPDTEWRVGEVVLGLYEVTGVLGQGGMGRVYRVRHRGWGVDLAVKAPLRKALEAAGGAEAFEREAETWVGLGLHPHVVSCYYVRRVDGVPRVFAEHVDGGSLQQAIREARLSGTAAALDVAIQFAWGLHYAHEQGLVHRDVKPGNVLLTSEGVAKVTDFGLAGARVAPVAAGVKGDQTTMAPGGAGGTPAYMSPEQWSGQPLTRRTDVWSWALAVLELFRGRREWELGPAAPVALQRCLESAEGWAIPLPAGAAALIERCVQEDVERRPRTLAEAADALAAVYAEVAGAPYPRTRPTAGRDTADSLNNRAVSLLDLGRSGAEQQWALALRADPQHLETSYNVALHAWSHGRIGDEELLSRVEAAERANGATPRAAELMEQARQAAQGGSLPEGRVLRLEGAHAVALTASSRLLALAKAAPEVRVWGEDGEPRRPLAPVDLRVRAVAPAPGAGVVLLAGEGGAPQLWDVDGARPTQTLPRFPGLTNAAAVSADGRRAVMGGSDRVVRVFELPGGRALAALEGHEEAVSCVAVDARGSRAASGGLDGTVRVWDLERGVLLHALDAHRGRVNALCLSRDGQVLLSGGEDRTLRQWDAARGTAVRTLLGPTSAVTGVLLDDDAREALAASLDRSLRTWDLGAGMLRSLVRAGTPVSAVARGKGAVWLATSSGLREVPADGPAWRPLFAVSRPLSVGEVEHRDAAFVQRVAEARLAMTQGDVGRALSLARAARSVPGHERSPEALTLWDEVTSGLAQKALVSAWEEAQLEGHADPVVSVAVSADGTRGISGDLAGHLCWWDLHQRGLMGQALGHEASVAAVALSADGQLGVSGSWDRTVRVWHLGQAKVVRVMEGHGDYVNAVALSPSGRRLLSASSDQTLRLWDVASGREVGVLAGHEAAVSGCAFGPDGRFAISASWDGSVRLWDVESRSVAAQLEGHEAGVAALAMGPDGRQAVSGGIDGTIRLWDLAQRRPSRVLSGHASEITMLVFLPTGRHVVSAGRDRTVRLWDLARGSVVRTLPHTGAVLAAAALPSGNGLLCAGTERVLTLWRLEWEADAGAATRETLLPAPVAPTVQFDAGHTVWEDLQRAAPRVGAREAAVQAARQARKRMPRGPAIALAAALALSLAGAVAVLRPRKVELGFSSHQGNVAREELLNDVVDLAAAAGACPESYERYLELARERMVAEETLGCLLRDQQPGLAEVYLRDLQLHDPEGLVAVRKRRHAVSFLADLGEPAVSPVCRWLREGDELARRVAVRALAAHGSPDAIDCLAEATTAEAPEVRAASIDGIRFLVGRGALPVQRAWALLSPLAADPEPRVRVVSVGGLALFDFDHAQQALSRMETDPVPEVAQAARARLNALRKFRNLNPDLRY